MSDDNCRRCRELLGAHLFGGLDPDEEADLRRHLEKCPECLEEEADLRAVMNLLDEDAELLAAEDPPPRLKERIVEEVFGESERGVRPGNPALVAAAAITVALLIGTVSLFTVFSDSGNPPGLGDEEPISFASEPGGVRVVEASVVAHTWGTELLMEVEGLREGEVYSVEIEREDGTTAPGGTMIGVGENPIDCALNAAVLRQNAEAITIADSSGEVILRSRLEDRPPSLYT
jgi:hypothetical protein